jgi:subtilisin family serine protease
MSLGGGSAYQPTINAIKLAMSKGIIVCIAAGNAGFNGRYNTIGWPAKSRQGVVVGATTSSGGRASFSSGGRELDMMAPGQRIISCKNDGSGWTVMSGTSMATPFVAGGFSLIVERMRAEGHAKWTAIESVRRFIQLNAKDMLTPGFDNASGWGIFNMTEVLHRIAAKELRFV